MRTSSSCLHAIHWPFCSITAPTTRSTLSLRGFNISLCCCAARSSSFASALACFFFWALRCFLARMLSFLLSRTPNQFDTSAYLLSPTSSLSTASVFFLLKPGLAISSYQCAGAFRPLCSPVWVHIRKSKQPFEVTHRMSFFSETESFRAGFQT